MFDLSNEKTKALLKYLYFWLICSCSLFLLFEISVLYKSVSFPFLGLSSDSTSVIPGVGDSYLVLNRLVLGERGVEFWHPLAVSIQNAYMGQFGLQGILLSAANKIISIEPVQFALFSAHIFSFLTACTISPFCLSIYRMFGKFPAGFTLAAIGLSPWLAGFSLSLYWAVFLLLAPFVFCWVTYPFLNKKFFGKVVFYFFVFILVFLKSLCGYEYITTVILSCTVPIFFYQFQKKDFQKTELILELAFVFSAGIIGFLAALGIHILQLSLFFGTSGTEAILSRVTSRTAFHVGSDHQALIGDFQKQVSGKLKWVSPVLLFGIERFFQYFKMPALELQLPYSKQNIVLSIGSCVLVSLLICSLLILLRSRIRQPKVKALALSTIFSLVAPLSWQILAFNHMSVHLHLNAIVFYVPFLLLFYATFGVSVQLLLNHLFSKSVQRFAACFLIAIVFVKISGSTIGILANRQIVNALIQPAIESSHGGKEPADFGLIGSIDGIKISNAERRSSLVGIENSVLALEIPPQQFLHIYGWLVNLNQPSNPVDIVVAVDKFVVYYGKTSRPRRDVEDSLDILAPLPGFDVYIPMIGSLSEGLDKSRIHIYGISNGNSIEVMNLTRALS